MAGMLVALGTLILITAAIVVQASGISASQLSLEQWAKATGGILVALVFIVLVFFKLREEVVDEKASRQPKAFAIVMTLIATLFLYWIGAYFAYTISLNKKESRTDAVITSLYTWGGVGGTFINHMYENRSIPLGKAWEEFKRLATAQPKQTSQQ